MEGAELGFPTDRLGTLSFFIWIVRAALLSLGFSPGGFLQPNLVLKEGQGGRAPAERNRGSPRTVPWVRTAT